jgi:aryl carrier-like protein
MNESFTAAGALNESFMASPTVNLVLEYRADLFDAPVADAVVRSVADVLNHAAAAPDTPVADLPVVELGAAFPLTPNGKVDRAALPPPEWAGPTAADQVPPRDPVEATMARILADLLRTTAPIDVHDNLFTLGAGSLTVVRFAARIADTYGVNLPMHRIVATPTIAELAEIVSADSNAGKVEETARDAELAALSDEELDDLLRAAQAARARRRAARGDVR